jgi:hypothetical protein
MRRFARWLLAFSAAGSLLLCVAVIVLWVLSYSNRCGVRRIERTAGDLDNIFAVESAGGGVILTSARHTTKPAQPGGSGAWEFRSHLLPARPTDFLFDRSGPLPSTP